MAELILSPIADKIVGSLASAAVKEIALIWGVNDELDELDETISTINAMLLDAEEKQIHSHQIRNWLQRLGGVVRDADDLMDEFDTEALRRQVMAGNEVAKQVCTFFSASNQLVFRHKMGRRIREIKKKLDVARNDRSFLLLEARSPDDQESRVVRKRETHSFVPQDEVIGRDNDRETIIKLLLESHFEENVSVIPVVGMGGLGKTTLAQSVFNDERVKQHFELKAWVCVSDTFDLKVIVQTITKSKGTELDQLQEDLRKILGGKRYLLVLDDVWEENREKWLELRNLLIGGAEGSRVVVTTRSKVVAGVTSAIEPYQLGVLDEEKSWSLFEKMAFRQGQEENNSNLVGIGKEIVKRCGGIPLAIRAIGSALYSKSLESEWSSFNKEFSKLPQGDSILPTLRLSYDNLTSRLKLCFVYCRLFPKDYRIEVQKLIQLWMAQGFLKVSDPSKCLEDVGYGYFVDLFERSFFQEIEINEFGVVESCKMHDLIHDLAIELAGQEYLAIENSDSLGNINKNTRHLSFDFGTIESQKQIPTLLLKAKKIQTVLLLEYNGWENNRICDAVVSKCKQARAVDFKQSDITMVPNSIRRLKFVRYLDLSGNSDIKTLPNSIASLLNLQTLKLNRCCDLQELPRDIKKLVNLRHLEIEGCDELRHMPVGLGQLTNLTTLSMFVLPESSGSAPRHSVELKELMGLNNLRGQLEISNLRYAEESESANLKEKQYLQSLYLKWDFSYVAATEANITRYEMSLEGLQPHPNLQKLHLRSYGGVKIPSWLQSLTNLVSLSLKSCKSVKHLVPMSQFCHLKNLELDDLPSLEYITNSYNDDNFLCSSLQTLSFSNLPNLKGWWNKNKPFPSFSRLTSIRLYRCPNLTYMPLYPHLEGELYLYNASSKPFLQTMSETSSFSPLSKLKTLTLNQIEDLEGLPDCFDSLSSLQDLKGIRSLTSLTSLRIESFPNLTSLPEGIRSLTSLTSLRIKSCPNLTSLPEGIRSLTSLTSLSIESCPNLTSLPEGIRSLTSLTYLKIGSSPNLTFLLEGIRSLTCLTSFTIGSSPNLTFFLEGIRSLTSLMSLRIESCPNLTSLPEGIRSLTSLTSLSIWNCPNLTSLPEGVRSLTSLMSLRIESCPNLTSLPEGIRSLTSLTSLSIWNCPNLTSLPEGVRSLTSLTSLRIGHCPNLTSLLEGIRSLTSLTSLRIESCPNLTSLPEGIRSLTSLTSLAIWNCPILLKRCQRQIGEDWPKIAHIPQLYLCPDPNFNSGSEATQKIWKLLKICMPR